MTKKKAKPSPQSIAEGRKLPKVEREKALEEDPTLAYFVGSAERRDHERKIKYLEEQLAAEKAKQPASTPEEDLRFFTFFGKTAGHLHGQENERANQASSALQNLYLLWIQEMENRKAIARSLTNLRNLVGKPTQICPKCGKVEWSKVMQTLLCPDCARS
jgi:hypothetical protein